MLPTVPGFVAVLFLLLSVITMGIFYFASNRNKNVLMILIAWFLIQSIVAFLGFYQATDAMPPRLALGIIPTFLAMAYVFFSARGKRFIASLNMEILSYLHTVRIPVEIGLFLLYSYGAISVLQTFEGWNYDILSGITAPIMAWLYFSKKKIGSNMMLLWNVLCLILVLTIVVISTLAAPFPLQQLSFDQPNIGILYFPYNLLPTLIVPLVIFSHLVGIKYFSKAINN